MSLYFDGILPGPPNPGGYLIKSKLFLSHPTFYQHLLTFSRPVHASYHHDVRRCPAPGPIDSASTARATVQVQLQHDTLTGIRAPTTGRKPEENKK